VLDPNQRALYADSLRPPPGRIFDQGLATTYSLGLDTLLTIPLQLALFDRRNSEDLLKDGVAVLEALRRTSSRLSIYCQQGQIHVPAADQVLYGMLEPIVHEVRAPGGGSFHAKVWVLRYVDPSGDEDPCLRVVVLSRNLTFDRSWDLSLLLEGSLRKGVQRSSRGLARLVRELPKISARRISPEARDRAVLLADEISRTRFALPENFEELSLHVHGLGGRRWIPPDSAELAVISPFCDDTALQELASTTSSPIALVSRAEALDALSDETLNLFSKTLVLDETAETEDGEDTSVATSNLRGLHAKTYIMKTGWDTRIALGSANATRPGLLNGRNVELLAELAGKASRVGKVQDLLGKEDFGDILTEYVRPDETAETDPAELEAERALDAARLALADAAMAVRCASDTEDDAWRLALTSKNPLKLDGIADLRAWPITLSAVHATDVTSLANGGVAEIGACALASVTGLVAFEATASAAKQSIRFVLNLPLENLPEGRDAAVMRTIISNQEGFLRYLALLLADLGEDPFAVGIEGGGGDWGQMAAGSGLGDLALLEHLIRALSREPERLRDIRRVIARLQEGEEADQVIPPEFLALWSSFERALGDEP
jgi:hypothetical protein